MPKTNKNLSPCDRLAAVREIGGDKTAGERLSTVLVDENELIAELKCLIARTRLVAYRPVTMDSVNAEAVLWVAIRTFCRSEEEFAGVRRSFEKIYLAHLAPKFRRQANERIAMVTKLLQGVNA